MRLIARRDPIAAPASFSAELATTLVDFMGALTAPAALDLSSKRPSSVPSGLPVD